MRQIKQIFIASLFLFITSPVFADAFDNFDKVTELINKAESTAKSSCGQTVKSELKSIFSAIKNARKACKELRSCKKKARKAKRSTKKSARSDKHSCKDQCSGIKNKKKQKACKKKCKSDFRGDKKKARSGKRSAVKSCRDLYKTSACKNARRKIGGGLISAVKNIVKDEDCREKIKKIGELIKAATAN